MAEISDEREWQDRARTTNALTSDLGGMTERELVAYATMLSMEDESPSRAGVTGGTAVINEEDIDEEVALAMALSASMQEDQ